jgi:hypothetical protein
MIGASIQKSPPKNVVLPHFMAGSISFIVLSVLTLLSSDILTVHFYNPKILAITHIITLGWITMFIMGSLYQLIPVIFESGLYSNRLAVFNFWFLVAGLSGFITSFWISGFMILMPVFSTSVFLSVILFCINIALSYKKAEKKNISVKFIITAVFWLFITVLIGLLLAFNYRFGWIDNSNFRFLKIHALFGLTGWFLQLVMGVAITLIPMFLVSDKIRYGLLKYVYYFLNSGIVMIYLFWQFNLHSSVVYLGTISIISAIVFFLIFIYDSYKKKLRKLDVGMKHSMLAFACLLLPITMGLIIVFEDKPGSAFINKAILLYGFSAFFAFFTNIILGQSFKTIPFIVWLHKYQSLVGKVKTTLPRELYNEKIASGQFYVFHLMLIIFISGVVFSNVTLIQSSGILMVLTSVLFSINIFKIIFHKRKI